MNTYADENGRTLKTDCLTMSQPDEDRSAVATHAPSDQLKEGATWLVPVWPTKGSGH